ncbi:hypothetical protein QWT69_06840 [Sporosarcina oncorhynchi]|uniref:Uncharacterized protein n=1 Tax=Sporosarcina oncorhynchi TaxID=3056444 RepID=A0ABZ0L964_9BACL|nr:hypothetical protein [Sporosarcina sp. T2O-4]WOV88817.1 hypothetical protein QWT69_06840 [Sporosarcina sp. T2O-4]
MKKLFKMNSSISIEDFNSVRITGPYSLLKLGPDYAAFKSGNHIIEAVGEELIVETLSEEMAVLSFESITCVSVKEIRDGQESYDS